MTFVILQIFNPVICLAANAFIQIAIIKSSAKPQLLRSIFYGFAAGLIILLSIEYCIHGPAAVSLVNFMTYCALAYCYFHFINLGETARRIRILRELYSNEDGLSAGEILERYNAKEIIARRIGRLLDKKQLIDNDGRYIARKGIMEAASSLILIMRFVLFGNTDERAGNEK